MYAGGYSVNQEEFYQVHYQKLLGANYCGSLQRNCWNKVYSKKLIKSLLPTDTYPRMFMGEDAFLNLQLLSSVESVVFFDKSFYDYRKGTGGTSKFNRFGIEDYSILKEKQISEIQRIYLNSGYEELIGSCHIETVYSSLSWFCEALKHGYSFEEAKSHVRSFDYCRDAKSFFENRDNSSTTAMNQTVINTFLSEDESVWMKYNELYLEESKLTNRIFAKLRSYLHI